MTRDLGGSTLGAPEVCVREGKGAGALSNMLCSVARGWGRGSLGARSTSEVPMPKASAPKAPCVAVCESPQTQVQPGTVKPCSGPMMCTIPWRLSDMPKYGRSKSCTFCSSASTWHAAREEGGL